MKKQLAIALAALQLAGCMTLPDYAGSEIEHISHPFAGPPFGPPDEEDTLNHLKGFAGWRKGRCYAELFVGYRLNDGGFYGPKLTGGGSFGVMFKGERR